jgi:hypothetical protein
MVHNRLCPRRVARSAVILTSCGAVFLALATAASAARTVTPGWECIPTTAGRTVVSGGDSTSGPSCGSGATAVLAPTYVASGIDGKPTVQFASVNVQIVDGSGSTSSVNGTGNLVLGYDELPGSQSGSHNLILGENQSDTSYGGLIGGVSNRVSGPDAFVAGGNNNRALGGNSAVIGGWRNEVASSDGSSQSQLGGQLRTLSSSTDNEIEVGGSPFAP